MGAFAVNTFHVSLFMISVRTGNVYVARRLEIWQETLDMKDMPHASKFYSLLSLELPPSAFGRAEPKLVAIQLEFHLW